MLLVPAKLTRVKMLPFDNKSELQVVIDTPEGTSLEETQARDPGDQRIPEDRARGPELPDLRGHVGALQFQRPRAPLLLQDGEQPGGHPGQFRAGRTSAKSQSHEIAKRIRPPLQAIADKMERPGEDRRDTARAARALDTLVAEVYGPDFEQADRDRRRDKGDILADERRGRRGLVRGGGPQEDRLRRGQGEGGPERHRYRGGIADGRRRPRRQRSRGLPTCRRRGSPSSSSCGRRCLSGRASSGSGRSALTSASGEPVSLAELVRVREVDEDKTIYRKNLKRVVYVIGDVAGSGGEPRLSHTHDDGGDKEAQAPRGLRAEAVLGGPALARRQVLHEVGRRMAYHLRGLQGPGHRLRRRPRPDLRHGRGVVQVVPDARWSSSRPSPCPSSASCRAMRSSAPSSRPPR